MLLIASHSNIETGGIILLCTVFFRLLVHFPHLDIGDAHKVQTVLMIHALSRQGELFVLSQLLKVYGIPKLVVLSYVCHKLAPWTGTTELKDRRLLLLSR